MMASPALVLRSEGNTRSCAFALPYRYAVCIFLTRAGCGVAWNVMMVVFSVLLPGGEHRCTVGSLRGGEWRAHKQPTGRSASQPSLVSRRGSKSTRCSCSRESGQQAGVVPDTLFGLLRY
jgi:hypothetical protein